MDGLTRHMPRAEKVPGPDEAGPLFTHEWLVTNGLGGYASGTVSGTATRRYHGLLIAALAAPFGRTMMLNHLLERLELPDGTEVFFGESERGDHSPEVHGRRALCRLPARRRLAGVALRSGWPRPGKASLDAVPAEHSPRHLSAAGG